MIKKKIIFIVLVYGNYNDLKRFDASIPFNRDEYKIIVVDSFKDKKSTDIGKKISEEIDADFITVENKGYGSGNNAGIKYAQKFNFDYLFISNPDVEIESLTLKDIGDNEIVGPKIITDSGKNQNPYYYKKEKIGFSLLKRYVKTNKQLWYYLYLINNKIAKTFQQRIANKQVKKREVYALHGSFYGMKKETLTKLVPIFDEKMFLYAEEDHIAELAKSKNIKMIYDSNWVIYHHEDGSGSIKNSFKNKIIRKSLQVFFKNWD